MVKYHLMIERPTPSGPVESMLGGSDHKAELEWQYITLVRMMEAGDRTLSRCWIVETGVGSGTVVMDSSHTGGRRAFEVLTGGKK